MNGRPLRWTRCHNCHTVISAVWSELHQAYLYGRHTLPVPPDTSVHLPRQRCGLSFTRVTPSDRVYATQREVPLP